MKKATEEISAEERTQREIFFLNLKFFRENLKMTIAQFCDADNGIGISVSHYENFAKLRTPVNPSKFKKLDLVVDALNELIRRDGALSARFPHPIMPTEIITVKFYENQYGSPDDPKGTAFYSYKFLGNYITYYTSTNTNGEKQTQYGVIRLAATPSIYDFKVEGLFSIKTYEEALAVFEQVNASDLLELKMLNLKKYAYYAGEAHITFTMLWINMTNSSKSECVSMSFDLASQILTKNPDRKFYGARGIALSQSSGQGTQTVTFPIVLTKKELACSNDELKKYLHFAYTKIDEDSLLGISEQVIALSDSLGVTPELKAIRTSTVEQYLKHAIATFLDSHVYNSHYYRPDELDQFYKEVIAPIRNKNFDPTEE